MAVPIKIPARAKTNISDGWIVGAWLVNPGVNVREGQRVALLRRMDDEGTAGPVYGVCKSIF